MKLGEARHAFITGGASGIGLGIADALAARGLRVTLADVDAGELDAVLAERSEAFRGQVLDVRDREAWAVAKREAEAAFGPVDVLVNNAGIAPNGRELVDTDPASFDRIVGINLVGVFNGVSAFGPEMRARGGGHIVNTSSMAGLAASAPGVGSYTTAKFGVTGLTEQLRDELAPHGVGVSLLCPGYVETNLARNTLRVGGEVRAPGGNYTMPPGTLSPREIGELVANAVAAGEFYIVSHPQQGGGVKKRIEELTAAFARALSRG